MWWSTTVSCRPEIMALVPAHIRRIDVGKMPKFHTLPQEAINDLLVSLARRATRSRG